MIEGMKKKWAFLLAFVTGACFLQAQDYFTGKITGKTAEQKIYYDRTQNALGASIHQSVYKVMDESQKTIYTVTVTHDNDKSLFFFAI
jgi:hypothetical protein